MKVALLESVLAQHPTLGRAYKAKEGFRAIWKCKSAEEAQARYDEWLRDLPADIAPAFDPLKTAMKNWRKEIFAYFRLRVTNAYTESFNAIARKMDRMGRGYSFKVLRAKLLMKYGPHAEQPPGPFVRNATPEKPEAYFGVPIATLKEDLEKVPAAG
jgi:transposase